MSLFHMERYVSEIFNSSITHISSVITQAFLLVWPPQLLMSLDHSSSTGAFSLALSSGIAQA